MLARLRQRLPEVRTIESRIETLALEDRFDLIIAPANIIYLVAPLRSAARHLDSHGSLAIELANPHWLRAGGGDGVRVLALDGNESTIDVDYLLPDGRTVTQRADISLVWPEEVENWLATGAGLSLQRMFGRADADLASSPSYYVVAGLQ